MKNEPYYSILRQFFNFYKNFLKQNSYGEINRLTLLKPMIDMKFQLKHQRGLIMSRSRFGDFKFLSQKFFVVTILIFVFSH
jgi:hypothetical protein